MMSRRIDFECTKHVSVRTHMFVSVHIFEEREWLGYL